MRVFAWAWRLIGDCVGAALIVVYFTFKVAVMVALWVVAGPLALLLAILCFVFIRAEYDDDEKLRWTENVIGFLESILSGLDRAAWAVYNPIDRVFGKSD